jgi:hypothetical protein
MAVRKAYGQEDVISSGAVVQFNRVIDIKNSSTIQEIRRSVYVPLEKKSNVRDDNSNRIAKPANQFGKMIS